jgi:hypothetical protein
MGPEQSLDLLAQLDIASACLVQKSGPLVGRSLLEGVEEERFGGGGCVRHI